MELTSLQEDLIANAILGFAAVVLLACRDLCKRISHSDCKIDAEKGLILKLPTWRPGSDDEKVQELPPPGTV
jgi:hypothetical protein